MLRLHPLAANAELIVTGRMAPLDAAREAEVAALWEAEQARRGTALFNGQVFSLDDLTPQRLTGRFVEYRRLIAQRARPELYPHLRVRPLSVSGLLRCADGLVLGRRHGAVTQDAGLWELVPSGGIDPRAMDGTGRIDLRRPILDELAEEVGLAADQIARVEPFCLVEDSEAHVFDIGLELASPLGGAAVLALHRARAGEEYETLAIVAEPDLGRFVAELGPRLAAVSRRLLEWRGLVS